jgi:hypothetical protein
MKASVPHIRIFPSSSLAQAYAAQAAVPMNQLAAIKSSVIVVS